MTSTLASFLLSQAKRLPKLNQERPRRGRTSNHAALYEQCRPAIVAALSTGMTVTEVTDWILRTLPKEQQPPTIAKPSSHWTRWYGYIRRIKANQDKPQTP
jgi:hypothetical protein